MNRIVLVMLICISGLTLKSQTNLDSLYSVWQDETQPDSSRVSSYKDYIGKGFLFSKPDTAFILAQALLTYGEQHKYPKAKALAYNLMGVSSANKSDNPKALEYYQRSIKIAEEIGNKEISSIAINNIGNIYFRQEDYHKALKYYQRSLKIKEELGDKKGSAITITNIGIIYSRQGEYSKALEYYQRSLKISEEIGNKRGSAITINNIASVYRGQGDYPKALIYFQRSLKIKEELGDKKGMALVIKDIGTLYQMQGDYPKALEYCKRAVSISEEIGALDREKEACKCLYDTYKAMGKGNEALVYLEKILVIDDSLNAQEIYKKLLQMEFDKRVFADSLKSEEAKLIVEHEHEREVLEKEKQRNILLGSALFILLFSGGLWGRLRYVKKAKSAIEKEKDRSEMLLLNILPAEVAEELKEKGHSDAQLIDHVTVLFTDFKGFTALSEQVTPRELVADLHACFSEFDHICGKYGIEKIKTIGDAYMAAGGLPIPNQTHATDVVKAALAMAGIVEKGKSDKIAANLPFFEIRIGVHTGPVVAGIVGVKKFQYDIWGDTVNTASRMESSGAVGKVNISQATYEILKDDSEFTFESRGKIEAKGKGEIDMYFVKLSGSAG
jgi:adenylate cyclase